MKNTLVCSGTQKKKKKKRCQLCEILELKRAGGGGWGGLEGDRKEEVSRFVWPRLIRHGRLVWLPTRVGGALGWCWSSKHL